MNQALQRKRVLVTGGSRGIGAAIALELARQGYHVIGTATTDSGAQAITQALSAYPGCRGAALIVNDGAAVDALIDEIVKTQGGLHVLVNNAGITRDMLAMRLKDDDWDAVIDTNLKAVFRASRAAIRPMMKQRFGRIINITSVVGAAGNPGQANYCASKAGVAGMTRSLAQELGSRNITVNCVAPGLIDTAILDEHTPVAEILKMIPAQRMGSPEEVAHAVRFLMDEKAAYITRQVISVNGGLC